MQQGRGEALELTSDVLVNVSSHAAVVLILHPAPRSRSLFPVAHFLPLSPSTSLSAPFLVDGEFFSLERVEWSNSLDRVTDKGRTERGGVTTFAEPAGNGGPVRRGGSTGGGEREGGAVATNQRWGGKAASLTSGQGSRLTSGGRSASNV